MALGQVHTNTVGHVEPTIRQTALEPSIKNYREQLEIETDDMIGCVVNEQKIRHFGKKKVRTHEDVTGSWGLGAL